MDALIAILAQEPVRLLRLIARARGLTFDTNTRKADLIERLAPQLLQDPHLQQRWLDLPPASRQVVVDLHLAGGRLPARHLVLRYGRLRPVATLAQGYQAANPDSPDPPSPIETLRLLGLVFEDRSTQSLFLPRAILAQLVPFIEQEASPSLPAETIKPEQMETPALLLHDLTCLLARLQREPVQPLHNRWLPPTFLQRWGALNRIAPETPAPRSELQTNRRRFLHYLAENAGQLSALSPQPSARNPNPQSPTPNPHSLLPTPRMWAWLKAEPAAQLQALWHSWTSPDQERWRAFRLPGYAWLPDPRRLVRAIHDGLVEQGSRGQSQL